MGLPEKEKYAEEVSPLPTVGIRGTKGLAKRPNIERHFPQYLRVIVGRMRIGMRGEGIGRRRGWAYSVVTTSHKRRTHTKSSTTALLNDPGDGNIIGVVRWPTDWRAQKGFLCHQLQFYCINEASGTCISLFRLI